jgi:hypothetical protein
VVDRGLIAAGDAEAPVILITPTGFGIYGLPLPLPETDGDWAGFSLEFFGMFVEPEELPENSPALSFPVKGRVWTVQLWRCWAQHEGSPLKAEQLWIPGESELCSIRGMEHHHTLDQYRKAREAFLLLRGIEYATKPGPKPGTGAKYSTRESWHRAVREKMLTMHNTWPSAKDWQLTGWFGISERLLYDLMQRWGPKTLDDLRAGNFGDCDCRGCRGN